jgi:glycosyltransferase involved in cell wall biosynthesis
LREFVRGKYDAVWVHGYATVNSLHALVAAKLAGAKTLLRTDSTLIDRERGGAKRAARRMFFRGLSAVVDGVLTTGRMNAEYWSAVLPGKRQFLMPYAVDNAWFAAKAREAEATREELRAELGFERGRAVILFAGKLMERKRCGDLIAAHGAMADPKPYLLIVGDGEQRAALEAQATDAAVKFVGFKNQSELPRYYDLCDVFVLPSVHEPWGLIVNEVMACARAVIVSDEVGCWPDLVRDGESGFVVPARDVGRLGAALTRVTSEPGLARRMGEAGARRIAEWSFEEDVAGLRKALGELRA